MYAEDELRKLEKAVQELKDSVLCALEIDNKIDSLVKLFIRAKMRLLVLIVKLIDRVLSKLYTPEEISEMEREALNVLQIKRR